MINRDQIKRGFRFKNPYRGTVLEVVNRIPEDAPAENDRGKPGVLVYWDHLPGDGDYHEVVNMREREAIDNLRFIPIDRFLMWDVL